PAPKNPNDSAINSQGLEYVLETPSNSQNFGGNSIPRYFRDQSQIVLGIKCHFCREIGHKSTDCPRKVE
ncbi:hypothetical protein HK096_011654, partial [Nowakowskiella sp. JEL0078]